MDEAALIEEVAELLESEPAREFFARRAIDKSCFEVVHDLDPDGPITDSSFRVVATFPTNEEAAAHAVGLAYNATAQRLLPILRRVHNEAVERAVSVAEIIPTDWRDGTQPGPLSAYRRAAREITTAIRAIGNRPCSPP